MVKTARSDNPCLSDSSCPEDSLSKSELEVSQMSTSESIEIQWNCFNSDLESSQSSKMPEIPKENSSDSGTRSPAIIDGRITDDELFFIIKRKKCFTWTYSSYHAGWFCRTCQEYSDSHDQYWKTVLRTHNQHPRVFFSEHKNCQKHLNKSNIKKLMAKRDIVCQINKGL